jgi:hypothetical protein
VAPLAKGTPMPKIRLATAAPSVALACLLTVASCDPGDDGAAPEEASQPLSFDNLPGQSQPFLYDNGTVCNIDGLSFHCCPKGMVMTGAHLNNNRFKCALLNGGFTGKHLDGPGQNTNTGRNNMHSCPKGEVMFGYYRGSAVLNYVDEFLACALPSPKVVFEQVDGNPATSDGQMHICPEKAPDNSPIVNPGRFAMTGIHAANNRFNCGR